MALTKIRKSVISSSYDDLGLGSISLQNKNAVDITGGTLNGIVLGGTTPVTFTSKGITDTSTTNKIDVTDSGVNIKTEVTTTRLKGSNRFSVNALSYNLINLVDMSTILVPGDTALVNIAAYEGNTNVVFGKITLVVQRSNNGYSVSTLGVQPVANYINESLSVYSVETSNENYGNILKIRVDHMPGTTHIVKGQFTILSHY